MADERFPRDGRFIERVGSYDTLKDPAAIVLNKERIKTWYEKGVRPTKTVEDIFKKEGILRELRQ